MRRRLFTVFVIGLLAAASPGLAGSFGLNGSYWDTDELGDAFGGQLVLGFPIGASMVDVDFRGAYYEELEDDPVAALFEDDDPVFEPQSVRILPVELGLRFNFARDESINPYLGGGVTYFFIDPQRQSLEVDDELGYHVLGGARFGDQEGVAFTVEGFYRVVEARFVRGDVGEPEEPRQRDIDLDGPGVNVGLAWSW